MGVEQDLVEAMVIGAGLAGGLTDERREAILELVVTEPLLAELPDYLLDDAVAAARERVAAEGSTATLRRLAGSPHREDALRLLAAVAGVGGEPPGGREGLASALRGAGAALNLDEPAVSRLLAASPPPGLLDEPALEETYLDVLLAAAAADGRLSPAELDKLVAFACSRQEFRGLPRQEIEDLLTVSLQGFLIHGVSYWLESLREDLPELEHRRVAYRLASEMIAADSAIVPAERSFMADLRRALALEDLAP